MRYLHVVHNDSESIVASFDILPGLCDPVTARFDCKCVRAVAVSFG